MISKLKNMIFQMMAGANVATVIIMLLIGYSDRVNPQSFHLFANAGLAYPVFLIFNLLSILAYLFCFVKCNNLDKLNFLQISKSKQKPQ